MPEPQTISLAPTSIGKPQKTFLAESLYFDPDESLVGGSEYYATSAVFDAEKYFVHFRSQSNVYLELGIAMTTGAFIYQSPDADAQSFNRALAERLCQEHPDISTDPGIFGGNPHINNVRLTVGNILGKLYNYGSVEAVANIYAPHVSESQIKEAIAYAQDFLEEAIHAGEPGSDASHKA